MWAAEWNEVVFTDESRICLQHQDGRIRVWRHRGDRILNSCFMYRLIGPAPGILVYTEKKDLLKNESSLHHYDIPAVTSVLSDLDIVKSPNCDILADFYVKVLTTCCDVKNAHNILLKNHPDERLAQLLSWINQFYKFNIEQMFLITLKVSQDFLIMLNCHI
ncbi:transposable element Tcb1 transposase [Trichonephila clavipes]|uniref:Transposable element Tcb1 transposase n=1 Tax=Trichonephila clavipes TaxID=2585209 RepID=A0A8X6UW26_TRICX|nr:transposable element Tcb1 transposase [Trichonephila clavipes]